MRKRHYGWQYSVLYYVCRPCPLFYMFSSKRKNRLLPIMYIIIILWIIQADIPEPYFLSSKKAVSLVFPNETQSVLTRHSEFFYKRNIVFRFETRSKQQYYFPTDCTDITDFPCGQQYHRCKVASFLAWFTQILW